MTTPAPRPELADPSVVPPQGQQAAEDNERAATVASIRPLFEPSGIAVIGASTEPAAIGRRVFDALLAVRSSGDIYPIHPRAAEIAGVPAFPSVSAIGRPVELAIVAIPRGAVLAAVEDCAQAGVKGLVVITAGFAETDEEGRALQRQLVETVRGHGMRMVGPNCLGILNTDPAHPINGSFSPIFPPAGGFALSSQSGALGVVILALAASRSVGISGFVSVGNKADVSGNDLLQYWEAEDRTRVIGLYLESFGNPRRFARIARRVSRRKPIVVVKSGRTAAGLRAASSHTAALATRDVAVDALLRQTGAIRTDTIDEMFDVAACLASQPLPPGSRVAIVTNAGGPGILAADACETSGLEVARLGPELEQRLAAVLPAMAKPSNPVDMIASAGPDAYSAVIAEMLQSSDIDALMVLYTPVDRGSSDRFHAAIADAVERARRAGGAGKPVVACLLAETGFRLDAGDEQIPVYPFPENAARALARATAYARWRALSEVEPRRFTDLVPGRAEAIVANATSRGGGWLTPEETRGVLDAFGLRLTPTVFTRSADEAAKAAGEMGFPVVAKLVATGLVHKTEVGGVRTGLGDEAALRAAFEALRDIARRHALAFEGVVVQPMSRAGVEVMVGLARDPSFGPLVGFGLGGIDVEVLGDVRFALTPLTERDAADLIQRSRAHALLTGHRGRPIADVAALEELLLRLSVLAESVTAITEIDLNPVMVMPKGQGCVLVDARVKIAGPGPS